MSHAPEIASMYYCVICIVEVLHCMLADTRLRIRFRENWHEGRKVARWAVEVVVKAAWVALTRFAVPAK